MLHFSQKFLAINNQLKDIEGVKSINIQKRL